MLVYPPRQAFPRFRSSESLFWVREKESSLLVTSNLLEPLELGSIVLRRVYSLPVEFSLSKDDDVDTVFRFCTCSVLWACCIVSPFLPWPWLS